MAGRALASARALWAKATAWATSLAGPPIELGKRKLHRHNWDLVWQVWLAWQAPAAHADAHVQQRLLQRVCLTLL